MNRTEIAIKEYCDKAKSILEAKSEVKEVQEKQIEELLKAGLQMHEGLMPDELDHFKELFMKIVDEEANKSVDIQPD
jgi:hypothetical protein